MVCCHFRLFGWRGKNGLRIGYVPVLHRDRTHHWKREGSYRWHYSGLWLQGGSPHNLIAKNVPHGGCG